VPKNPSRPPLLPAGEPSPWQTVKRTEVYSNPWIRLEQHDVIRPDGAKGIYGLVDPTHRALGVVALDENNQIYLVGQYRYTLNRYSWEIPEGGGHPDKDPQREAARELKEETGLVAAHWQHLMSLDTSNCFTSEIADVFLARKLTQSEACPEPTEKLKVIRVPFKTAFEAVLNGEITDAISVAAILYVQRSDFSR